MSLNTEQINALLAPLNPARVRQVQGNAHLEAWDVRRWLLRIFGWGGWDFTVTDCTLIQQIDIPPTDGKGKTRYTVVYRVIGRLTIKDPDGNVLAVFEDGATGDAQNQPSLGDAHDMALKTSMSQALKRCAMNLGDAYGLGLYDGGKTAAVVGRSLAHANTDKHEAREEVSGGEMDAAPSESPDAPARQVSSPPTPDQAGGGLPAPGENQAGALPDAELVATLRARVMTALDMPGQTGLMELSRIGIEVSRNRLAKAQTTTPDGKPVTFDVLLDGALKMAGRKQRGTGNSAADAAAGDAA